jgi:four helix bundle protein
MRVARFEDLAVWKKSKEHSRDLALKDQIRRAAVSVMSNIAEGFERYSRSEFRHFLSIARGSASEVRSQLYLAHELGYVPDSEFAAHLDLCLEISRMLAALHRKSAPRS